MLAKLALIAATAVVSVLAQQEGDFPIDINKVQPATRAAWCNAQYASCGTLCGGTPRLNECTSGDLKYNCTCQNGTAPGLRYYTETMPTFICKEAYGQCNALNANNAAGQRNCTTAIDDTCGKGNISQFSNSPSPSQSSSSSAGAGPSSTGGAGGQTAAPTPTGAAPRIENLGNTAAVVAVAAFAYLL